MKAFTYTISFLVAATATTVKATPLMCAIATQTSVYYHTYTVQLFLGHNSSCSGDAEMAFMEAMNQDLQLKIGSLSNAAPYVIQADLCPVIHNASRRALSTQPSSMSWYGKGSESHNARPRRSLICLCFFPDTPANHSRTIILFLPECSVCNSRSRTRGRRRLDEVTTAQEAAEMLGISQTQMVMEMFGSNPGSCLYQASDIQVRFNVTQTFYTSPPDPCEV